MRITHYIYSTLLAALALPFMASCDNIDEKDRLIDVEPMTVNRGVLVEEFSGQLCTNCPDGSEILESISHEYGSDKVVVVAFHCGVTERLGLHESNSKLIGLATDFGEDMYTRYGRVGQPSLVADRTSGVVNDMNTWMTAIANALKQSSTLQLVPTCSYDASAGTITVKVNGSATTDISGKMHVWLTEDGIVAPQRLKSEDKGSEADLSDGKEDGYNYNHVFNHIFRAALTPIEGAPVEYKWQAIDTNTQEFVINASGHWNVNNMTAVVFVETAEGVVQTTKCKVISD